MEAEVENEQTKMKDLRSLYARMAEKLEAGLTEVPSERGEKSGIEHLKWEFLKLRMACEDVREADLPEFSTAAAKSDENCRKNRYRDIVPFDRSRVILPVPEGEIPDDMNDYVNASYINGIDDTICYVAAQGPLQNTVADFWRLVEALSIETVVMLTRVHEDSKVSLKCSQYWPDMGDDEDYTFGNLTIVNAGEKHPVPQIVIRNLKVQRPRKLKEEEKESDASKPQAPGYTLRTVEQIQYEGWPDKGVPEQLDPLIKLIQLIEERRAASEAPVLVHCSAGCGRTGSIIALMNFNDLLRANRVTESFYIYNMVMDLRKQRIAMVQSADQYILLHRCIAYMLRNRIRLIDEDEYVNFPASGYQKASNLGVEPLRPPRPNNEKKKSIASDSNSEDGQSVDGSSVPNIPDSIPPEKLTDSMKMFQVAGTQLPDFPHRPVDHPWGAKREPASWGVVTPSN